MLFLMFRVLCIAALMGITARAQTSAPLPYLSRARLDRDGDQRVSEAEFLAVGAAAVAARLAGIDTDRNGTLSRTELASARAASEARFQALALDDPARAEYAAMPVFEELDVNRDGQVDKDEFWSAQEKSLRRRFQVLDHDGDGMLDEAEFDPARRRFLEQVGRPKDPAQDAPR